MSFSFGMGSNAQKTTGTASIPTMGAPTSTSAPVGSLQYHLTQPAGSGDKATSSLFGSAAKPLGTPATTGFSLGQPANKSTAPTLSFGTPAASQSSGGGLSFGTPASSQPTTGSLGFGVPAASQPLTGGLSFGTPSSQALIGGGLNFATPTTSQPSTGALTFGTPAMLQPSTGGLSFGTPAVSQPSAGGLNFGTPAAKQLSSGGFGLGSSLTGSETSTAASTTAPTLSFGFGPTAALSVAPTSSSAPKLTLGSSTSNSATTTASSGFSFGGTATTSTGVSTLTTSTTASSLSNVPSITFAQLEDFINKWTIDLEEQGKFFVNQAKQLNAWDSLLISNGEKILNLNGSIERVKQQQSQLDQELDFILAQQKELEELIVPLEKELVDIPVTDIDRNQMYQFAEIIDSQLKQISDDLKEIIENINESNKDEEASNPITQISKILNAHMDSLQWIDRNTAQISRRLEEISKIEESNKINLSLNNSLTSMF